MENRIITERIAKILPRRKITICDSNNNLMGWLRIVDTNDLLKPEILDSITSWRNKFKHFFKTQFEAKTNRTKKWLELIIETDNRLMFLIENAKGKPIGTYGVIFHNDFAELDNIICGEKQNISNFMYYVEKIFIGWLFQTFTLKYINANILSNNITAFALHNESGFEVEMKYPLRKEIFENGDISYEIDLNIKKPSAYYIEMRLDSKNYIK